MSRIPRKSYDSSYFHVVVQGFEKQYIFKKDFYKRQYLSMLLTGLEKYKIELLSYCIMDNHAHILLFCDTISEMSNYMREVNTQFAILYNKLHNRVGYVFRDRFLSEPIRNEAYLYKCISYIHMNPVDANMVLEPGQYKYSSYNDFINNCGIVNESMLKKIFGSAKDYIDTFQCIHSTVRKWNRFCGR